MSAKIGTAADTPTERESFASRHIVSRVAHCNAAEL